jgi:hypothetical protein
MRKLALIVAFIPFFLGACSPKETPAVDPEIAAPTAAPITAPAATQDLIEPVQAAPTPFETVGPNCLGDQIVPMGQSITDDYPFASYGQVMTWFCSGAEFEDIMVALETESQTGFSTEEMLELISKGFTWQDIWQHIGIMD